MKFCSVYLVFLAFGPIANAFAPNGGPLRTTPVVAMSMVQEDTDLSIPYDAAARLAYDQWRDQFGKGDFDPARYENFKANYEAIAVANVVAKKRARDAGSGEAVSLMTLNEFGDCTEEEYVAATSGGGASQQQPTTTGDVLGKALEAAQSQSEASSALEDAANALAEEEEVRSLRFVTDTCLRRSGWSFN